MASERYTIVVALANPATVEQLLRTASDLANQHNGRIHAVAVEHKPVSSPFLLFSDEHVSAEYAHQSKQILERAETMSDAAITTDLRIDSDVPGAIRRVVNEVDADALLVGWHKRSAAADVMLGTSVDSLLRRPPCDVLVERVGTVANGVDQILVPTVGGPHVELATDIAGAVTMTNEARVTVLSVISAEGTDAEQRTARQRVQEAAAYLPSQLVDHRIVEAPTPVTGILDVAIDHDLVILGATSSGWLRPPVIGSVARTVSGETTCPVIIAKHRTNTVAQRVLERVRPASH